MWWVCESVWGGEGRGKIGRGVESGLVGCILRLAGFVREMELYIEL